MFEQTIDKIKALSALIERQHKAEATRQAVEDIASVKAWKDTAKSFAHRLRGKKEFSTQISLSAYNKAKNASTFKHSQLGTNRLIDSSYSLQYRTSSDVRNGRRWIDRLPVETHNTLKSILKYYSLPSGANASVVAEGDPKPLRERVLAPASTNLVKLAVTDLVTQEVLYALPGEAYAEYVLETLLEHVYDSLEQQITSTMLANAFAFPASNYAGYIYRASGARPNWHDLISAMQREYQYQYHDLNFGVKYGDIIITGRRTMLGVLNDRHNETQYYLSDAHDIDGFVLDRNNIYWSEVCSTTPESLLLLNTDAFELHLLDAADVYMERVAESAQERNLYRLVAEVYFAVVPRYLGELSTNWPVIVSSDTLSDRNAL